MPHVSDGLKLNWPCYKIFPRLLKMNEQAKCTGKTCTVSSRSVGSSNVPSIQQQTGSPPSSSSANPRFTEDLQPRGQMLLLWYCVVVYSICVVMAST